HSEAYRLRLAKHKQDEQNVRPRVEDELTRRNSEINQRHKDELHDLTARTKELEAAAKVADQQNALEILHANRRAEDSLREADELRERNQVWEVEMSKVARVGKREEMDFAEEARMWPGVYVSDK